MQSCNGILELFNRWTEYVCVLYSSIRSEAVERGDSGSLQKLYPACSWRRKLKSSLLTQIDFTKLLPVMFPLKQLTSDPLLLSLLKLAIIILLLAFLFTF